ncbi:MAG TPA: hypothetical protein DEF04_02360 [Clostridiales bacterium]|nr:hypothetical protein [Clostridiales bacterium]
MISDINYIIQMTLNGDKKCQEILLKKIQPLIYKNIYLYWKPSDPVTEDLAQDGYEFVLRSLSEFNPDRNAHFLHYIQIKIIFFYKNYYRSTKNQRNEISLSDDMFFSEFLIQDMDSSQCPLVGIISDENADELRKNIDRLSAVEREIIYMHYYEHLTINEISELLNIPYSTAWGRKQSAIKKLRKYLTLKK